MSSMQNFLMSLMRKTERLSWQKLLIEECTELNLFVGTAVNDAHRESELNFDLSMRQNLVEQLVSTAEKNGKKSKSKVLLKYFPKGRK